MSRWLSVLVYMAGIFYLSSLSRPTLPIKMSDKLAHVAEYALLSALVLRAANGGFSRRATLGAVLLAFLLSSAYGASDEWHQSFVPGRVCSLGDLAADAAGSLLAALALAVATRRAATGDRKSSRPPL